MGKRGIFNYFIIILAVFFLILILLAQVPQFKSFVKTSPLFSPLANSLGAGTVETLDTSDGGRGNQNEDGTCTINANDGGISEIADELDTDCDGVPDSDDNCKTSDNPDQVDSDNDGVGDECDNCVDRWNPDQRDSDGDGTGDGCDICPNGQTGNDANDDDGDGVPNACDNCRYKPNIDQTDIDRDGHGDVCDNCVYQNNRDQNDTDHDGIGDICDDCSILQDTDSGGMPSRDIVPGICSKNISLPKWNVFVTNQTFDPNLEQPAGRADTLCQIAAVQGGVVSYADGEMGTYVAWLSTSTKNAKDKLTGDAKRPFVRIDGKVVANTKSDLLDGTLINPINIDEFNRTVGNMFVYTGTKKEGVADIVNGVCSDWKGIVQSNLARGVIGDSGFKDARWTQSAQILCRNFLTTNFGPQARLYCFQVSETMAACGDGYDNDGDTIIDWPNDPGCSSRTDGAEDNGYACSNGIDDDKDGVIDYPADPGCSSPSDNDEWDKWIKVCTPQDLDNVRNNLNGDYLQICDIDLQGINFEPIGGAWNKWEPFTGTYDGDGYAIRNWKYSSNENSYVGLFSVLYGGTITSVNLENVDVSSNSTYGSTGGLVGIASYDNFKDYSVLSNISVTGIVDGGMYETGGIVGAFVGGALLNSSFEGRVVGSSLVGGAVGAFSGVYYNESLIVPANIKNVVVKGRVESDGQFFSGNFYAYDLGGIVGGLFNSRASNLYSNVSLTGATYYLGGLIGFMGYNSSLTDSFSNSSVNGTYEVGGAVGSIHRYSAVKNVHFSGTASCVSSCGGLIGEMYSESDFNGSSLVESSSSRGNVIGSYGVGGLIGITAYTAIVLSSWSESNVQGIVDLPQDRSNSIGGLIGAIYGGSSIKKSYSLGDVSGGAHVGGLIGLSLGDYLGVYIPLIEDSYSRSSVSASQTDAGGLIGVSYDDLKVLRSYSTGEVSSPVVAGGLIGYTYGGVSAVSSYWDTQTSGQSTSAGGTGKTTAEMKTQSTYTGWDFSNTWKITSGEYPKLKWQT